MQECVPQNYGQAQPKLEVSNLFQSDSICIRLADMLRHLAERDCKVELTKYCALEGIQGV